MTRNSGKRPPRANLLCTLALRHFRTSANVTPAHLAGQATSPVAFSICSSRRLKMSQNVSHFGVVTFIVLLLTPNGDSPPPATPPRSGPRSPRTSNAANRKRAKSARKNPNGTSASARPESPAAVAAARRRPARAATVRSPRKSGAAANLSHPKPSTTVVGPPRIRGACGGT
jgi:hypothetical protein